MAFTHLFPPTIEPLPKVFAGSRMEVVIANHRMGSFTRFERLQSAHDLVGL